MSAKIKLMLALIATIILAVYAIELGLRILTANGKTEYLVVTMAIIMVLLVVDSRFYSNYKTEKRKNS